MRRFFPLYIAVTLLLFCVVTPSAYSGNRGNKEVVNYAMLHAPDPMPITSARHAAAPVPKESQLTLRRASRKGVERMGIDVSRHQGRIDWDEVARDHQVTFAYMKATEGKELVDRTYAYNLREAKRVGIKVGCYHFFSPTVPAAVQFKNFSANYNPNEQDLLPILDVELRGRNSSAQLRQKVNEFLRLFERKYGFKPLLYTSVSFYNRHFAGYYQDYEWMMARYHEDEPVMSDGRDYFLWQFTASGCVNGITGDVDISRFHEKAFIEQIMVNRPKR